MNSDQSKPYSDTTLRMTVYTALMAAFISVGAYLIIPIGPVPIVLQNLFVLLAGLLLGSRWGAACVAIYLLAGACGLPVFSGGGGGLGRLLGPTGGYLIGFLPAVYVVGLVSERSRSSVLPGIVAMIAATLIIYACGVPWLMDVTGMTFGKALAAGMLPFLIGDALKIAAAAAIARGVRPLMRGLPAHSGPRTDQPDEQTAR